jgi:vacuolar protein sorting-associated protein IST1
LFVLFADNSLSFLSPPFWQNIAALVREDKEELARIRVEVYMNDEKFVHLCELVALMCEKISIRLELLAMQPTLPEELKEAVHTVVYAAPRMEVEELKEIAHQMGLKFGREWLEEHQFGGMYVNKVVREKLEVSTPDPSLVQQYLDTIVDFCGGLEREKADARAARSQGNNGGNAGNTGGGNAAAGPPPESADLDNLFPAPPNSLGGNGNNTNNNGGGGAGAGGNFGVGANDVRSFPAAPTGNAGLPPAAPASSGTTPGGPGADVGGPVGGLGGIGGPGFPSLPPVPGGPADAPSSAVAPGAGDDLDMANLMARFDALRNKTDNLP